MATAGQNGKKPRIDDEEGEHIDGALLHSTEKLQEIQDEIERVNEEASDKVLKVEQKYDEIRRPVYARRNEIIKKIPDFWLTVFLSHPGDLLTEDNQKIFKHLVSIDVDESKDSYSITLKFSSNPYFEDTKLTKTYSFSDDGTIADIVSGKAYTKNGDKRLLIDESFFTWFSDAKNESFAPGEMDQVADIIKEDLWPKPLKFFNNEAEDEFKEEEEDEEESDGEDQDEEEEDDEEVE